MPFEMSTSEQIVNFAFKGTNQMGATLLAVESGLNSLTASAGALGRGFSDAMSLAQSASMSIGMGAAVVLGKATQSAMQYQSQLAQVQAISQSSAQSMDFLSNRAQELSEQYGLAMTEVNEGLVTLGRAGIKDARTQVGVLEEGFRMAKLEGMELNTALSDLITTTNLLNPEISMSDGDYDQVVKSTNEMLLQTSQLAPLDVQDVIHSLQYAGGSAVTVNMDEKDLMATIADLATKGTKGDIAGTALRNFMTRSVTSTGKSALESIGLTADDLWEMGGTEMRSIADLKEMLDERMKELGMTQQEQLEFWTKFGGPKQANQLMKLDPNDIRKFKSELDEGLDVEKEMALILNSPMELWNQLTEKATNFFINVGQKMLSVFSPIMLFLNTLIDKLNDIPFLDDILQWLVVGKGLQLIFRGIGAVYNSMGPSIATLLSKNSESGGLLGKMGGTWDDMKQTHNYISRIRSGESIPYEEQLKYKNPTNDEVMNLRAEIARLHPDTYMINGAQERRLRFNMLTQADPQMIGELVDVMLNGEAALKNKERKYDLNYVKQYAENSNYSGVIRSDKINDLKEFLAMKEIVETGGPAYKFKTLYDEGKLIPDKSLYENIQAMKEQGLLKQGWYVWGKRFNSNMEDAILEGSILEKEFIEKQKEQQEVEKENIAEKEKVKKQQKQNVNRWKNVNVIEYDKVKDNIKKLNYQSLQEQGADHFLKLSGKEYVSENARNNKLNVQKIRLTVSHIDEVLVNLSNIINGIIRNLFLLAKSFKLGNLDTNGNTKTFEKAQNTKYGLTQKAIDELNKDGKISASTLQLLGFHNNDFKKNSLLKGHTDIIKKVEKYIKLKNSKIIDIDTAHTDTIIQALNKGTINVEDIGETRGKQIIKESLLNIAQAKDKLYHKLLPHMYSSFDPTIASEIEAHMERYNKFIKNFEQTGETDLVSPRDVDFTMDTKVFGRKYTKHYIQSDSGSKELIPEHRTKTKEDYQKYKPIISIRNLLKEDAIKASDLGFDDKKPKYDIATQENKIREYGSRAFFDATEGSRRYESWIHKNTHGEHDYFIDLDLNTLEDRYANRFNPSHVATFLKSDEFDFLNDKRKKELLKEIKADEMEGEISNKVGIAEEVINRVRRTALQELPQNLIEEINDVYKLSASEIDNVTYTANKQMQVFDTLTGYFQKDGMDLKSDEQARQIYFKRINPSFIFGNEIKDREFFVRGLSSQIFNGVKKSRGKALSITRAALNDKIKFTTDEEIKSAVSAKDYNEYMENLYQSAMSELYHYNPESNEYNKILKEEKPFMPRLDQDISFGMEDDKIEEKIKNQYKNDDIFYDKDAYYEAKKQGQSGIVYYGDIQKEINEAKKGRKSPTGLEFLGTMQQMIKEKKIEDNLSAQVELLSKYIPKTQALNEVYGYKIGGDPFEYLQRKYGHYQGVLDEQNKAQKLIFDLNKIHSFEPNGEVMRDLVEGNLTKAPNIAEIAQLVPIQEFGGRTASAFVEELQKRIIADPNRTYKKKSDRSEIAEEILGTLPQNVKTMIESSIFDKYAASRIGMAILNKDIEEHLKMYLTNKSYDVSTPFSNEMLSLTPLMNPEYDKLPKREKSLRNVNAYGKTQGFYELPSSKIDSLIGRDIIDVEEKLFNNEPLIEVTNKIANYIKKEGEALAKRRELIKNYREKLYSQKFIKETPSLTFENKSQSFDYGDFEIFHGEDVALNDIQGFDEYVLYDEDIDRTLKDENLEKNKRNLERIIEEVKGYIGEDEIGLIGEDITKGIPEDYEKRTKATNIYDRYFSELGTPIFPESKEGSKKNLEHDKFNDFAGDEVADHTYTFLNLKNNLLRTFTNIYGIDNEKYGEDIFKKISQSTTLNKMFERETGINLENNQIFNRDLLPSAEDNLEQVNEDIREKEKLFKMLTQSDPYYWYEDNHYMFDESGFRQGWSDHRKAPKEYDTYSLFGGDKKIHIKKGIDFNEDYINSLIIKQERKKERGRRQRINKENIKGFFSFIDENYDNRSIRDIESVLKDYPSMKTPSYIEGLKTQFNSKMPSNILKDIPDARKDLEKIEKATPADFFDFSSFYLEASKTGILYNKIPILYKKFGSNFKNVTNKTIKELTEIQGIGQRTAKDILTKDLRETNIKLSQIDKLVSTPWLTEESYYRYRGVLSALKNDKTLDKNYPNSYNNIQRLIYDRLDLEQDLPNISPKSIQDKKALKKIINDNLEKKRFNIKELDKEVFKQLNPDMTISIESFIKGIEENNPKILWDDSIFGGDLSKQQYTSSRATRDFTNTQKRSRTDVSFNIGEYIDSRRSKSPLLDSYMKLREKREDLLLTQYNRLNELLAYQEIEKSYIPQEMPGRGYLDILLSYSDNITKGLKIDYESFGLSKADAGLIEKNFGDFYSLFDKIDRNNFGTYEKNQLSEINPEFKLPHKTYRNLYDMIHNLTNNNERENKFFEIEINKRLKAHNELLQQNKEFLSEYDKNDKEQEKILKEKIDQHLKDNYNNQSPYKKETLVSNLSNSFDYYHHFDKLQSSFFLDQIFQKPHNKASLQQADIFYGMAITGDSEITKRVLEYRKKLGIEGAIPNEQLQELQKLAVIQMLDDERIQHQDEYFKRSNLGAFNYDYTQGLRFDIRYRQNQIEQMLPNLAQSGDLRTILGPDFFVVSKDLSDNNRIVEEFNKAYEKPSKETEEQPQFKHKIFNPFLKSPINTFKRGGSLEEILTTMYTSGSIPTVKQDLLERMAFGGYTEKELLQNMEQIKGLELAVNSFEKLFREGKMHKETYHSLTPLLYKGKEYKQFTRNDIDDLKNNFKQYESINNERKQFMEQQNLDISMDEWLRQYHTNQELMNYSIDEFVKILNEHSIDISKNKKDNQYIRKRLIGEDWRNTNKAEEIKNLYYTLKNKEEPVKYEDLMDKRLFNAGVGYRAKEGLALDNKSMIAALMTSGIIEMDLPKLLGLFGTSEESYQKYIASDGEKINDVNGLIVDEKQKTQVNLLYDDIRKYQDKQLTSYFKSFLSREGSDIGVLKDYNIYKTQMKKIKNIDETIDTFNQAGYIDSESIAKLQIERQLASDKAKIAHHKLNFTEEDIAKNDILDYARGYLNGGYAIDSNPDYYLIKAAYKELRSNIPAKSRLQQQVDEAGGVDEYIKANPQLITSDDKLIERGKILQNNQNIVDINGVKVNSAEMLNPVTSILTNILAAIQSLEPNLIDEEPIDTEFIGEDYHTSAKKDVYEAEVEKISKENLHHIQNLLKIDDPQTNFIKFADKEAQKMVMKNDWGTKFPLPTRFELLPSESQKAIQDTYMNTKLGIKNEAEREILRPHLTRNPVDIEQESGYIAIETAFTNYGKQANYTNQELVNLIKTIQGNETEIKRSLQKGEYTPRDFINTLGFNIDAMKDGSHPNLTLETLASELPLRRSMAPSEDPLPFRLRDSPIMYKDIKEETIKDYTNLKGKPEDIEFLKNVDLKLLDQLGPNEKYQNLHQSFLEHQNSILKFIKNLNKDVYETAFKIKLALKENGTIDFGLMTNDVRYNEPDLFKRIEREGTTTQLFDDYQSTIYGPNPINNKDSNLAKNKDYQNMKKMAQEQGLTYQSIKYLESMLNQGQFNEVLRDFGGKQKESESFDINDIISDIAGEEPSLHYQLFNKKKQMLSKSKDTQIGALWEQIYATAKEQNLTEKHYKDLDSVTKDMSGLKEATRAFKEIKKASKEGAVNMKDFIASLKLAGISDVKAEDIYQAYVPERRYNDPKKGHNREEIDGISYQYPQGILGYDNEGKPLTNKETGEILTKDLPLSETDKKLQKRANKYAPEVKGKWGPVQSRILTYKQFGTRIKGALGDDKQYKQNRNAQKRLQKEYRKTTAGMNAQAKGMDRMKQGMSGMGQQLYYLTMDTFPEFAAIAMSADLILGVTNGLQAILNALRTEEITLDAILASVLGFLLEPVVLVIAAITVLALLFKHFSEEAQKRRDNARKDYAKYNKEYETHYKKYDYYKKQLKSTTNASDEYIKKKMEEEKILMGAASLHYQDAAQRTADANVEEFSQDYWNYGLTPDNPNKGEIDGSSVSYTDENGEKHTDEFSDRSWWVDSKKVEKMEEAADSSTLALRTIFGQDGNAYHQANYSNLDYEKIHESFDPGTDDGKNWLQTLALVDVFKKDTAKAYNKLIALTEKYGSEEKAWNSSEFQAVLQEVMAKTGLSADEVKDHMDILELNQFAEKAQAAAQAHTGRWQANMELIAAGKNPTWGDESETYPYKDTTSNLNKAKRTITDSIIRKTIKDDENWMKQHLLQTETVSGVQGIWAHLSGDDDAKKRSEELKKARENLVKAGIIGEDDGFTDKYRSKLWTDIANDIAENTDKTQLGIAEIYNEMTGKNKDAANAMSQAYDTQTGTPDENNVAAAVYGNQPNKPKWLKSGMTSLASKNSNTINKGNNKIVPIKTQNVVEDSKSIEISTSSTNHANNNNSSNITVSGNWYITTNGDPDDLKSQMMQIFEEISNRSNPRVVSTTSNDSSNDEETEETINSAGSSGSSSSTPASNTQSGGQSSSSSSSNRSNKRNRVVKKLGNNKLVYNAQTGDWNYLGTNKVAYKANSRTGRYLTNLYKNEINENIQYRTSKGLRSNKSYGRKTGSPWSK